jgi:hypothetical protein
MVRRDRARRGFALIDAILGGALLALGLATVVTLSQRSLSMLQRGENEAMAAAMLDELLAQVVVEGPRRYGDVRESAGRMSAPWPDWEYAVEIESGADGDPFEVIARVRDPLGIEYRCATRVAPEAEDVEPVERAPEKPIDRAARHDEKDSPNGN